MRFGPVATDQALGHVLAHSVALPSGRMRKGKLLTSADIGLLQAAGLRKVTVAQFAADDIDEDRAAWAVAQALVPDPVTAGLDLRAVGTGRVNIHSAQAGLAGIVAARINALNHAFPMITVATVARFQRMEAAAMVATIKIIPYAVAQKDLLAACVLGHAALQLHRPQLRKLALIETLIDGPPSDKGPPSDIGPLSDKGRRMIAKRVERLGASLLPPSQTAHDPKEVAAALKAAAAQGAEAILILTASATSDPDDTAPTALRLAGGEMLHFGMPVDPGNLLFIGQLHNCPVVGLPGCVRSPALNGADFVLERLICGLPVTGADIAEMGVGGLLKDIPNRPRRRDPS